MMRALPRRAAVALLTVAAMMLSLISLGIFSSTTARAAETTMSLVNFEGDDALVSSVQFYGAAGGGEAIYGEDGNPAAPSSTAGTTGLKAGYNLVDPAGPGYAGIVAIFGSPVDMSDFDGIRFWFYGQGLGAALQVELKDVSDTSNPIPELWDFHFVDSTGGWTQIVVPFSEFQRATDFQEGGAPTDGVLGLEAISEVAFPVDSHEGLFIIDEIEIYSGAVITPSIGFTATTHSVNEGGTVTIPVRLNVPSADPVTVEYSTVDGTATGGTDFTAVTAQTLTIPAGQQNASITIDTIDNTIADGNRTFQVVLSSPSGATLGGSHTATITIRDDEVAEASALTLRHDVIFDFEDELLFGDMPNNSRGWLHVVPDGHSIGIDRSDNLPGDIPGSPTGNHALELSFNSSNWSVAVHNLTDGTNWISQDWSLYSGIGFWMYGQNSGAKMFLDILDNRAPGSAGFEDTAERYGTTWVDDWTGWKFLDFDFSSMMRKNVNNGAPNDGFGLMEVHGFGIGIEGSSPLITPTIYFDDVSLIHLQEVIEDAEAALPEADLAEIPPVGWFSVGDWWEGAFGRTTTPPSAAPGDTPGNNVIEFNTIYQAWGALVHHFGDSDGNWVGQDWTYYTDIGFWMYGENSGAGMYFDVIGSPSAGANANDAPVFSADFVDDQLGWRFVSFSFADLNFKDVGTVVASDQLNLADVHGYAIGISDTSGAGPIDFFFDDVTLFGSSGENLPKTVSFTQDTYYVNEGDTLTATIKLSRALENDVTVDYAAVETPDKTSTEDPMARADRDFIPTSGTAVIPAGELTFSFDVETIDDTKPEVDETFSLILSNAVGADLSAHTGRALVSIRDNDPVDPKMIEDFEDGIGMYRSINGSDLAIHEIVPGDTDRYSAADPFEQVLTITNNGGIERDYAQPSDWSGNEGIGFWYNGTGSGLPVTVTVKDDKVADPGPDGWTLAWSDEFDEAEGVVPNAEHWTHETGGWGWGNDELQYYTPEGNNAFHDGDGNLVITMEEIDDPASFDGICHYGDCRYTSARLVTENKYEFMHGRVEARAFMPQGQGIWPAIWSLGSDFREVGWPQTGEIDIMEFVGKEPYEVFGTIHGPGYNGGNAFGNTHTLDVPVYEDWHTFAVEWEPGEIRWYLDDIEFHRATPADVAPNEWVFEHPFVLIMNMAVGGNFGGTLGADLTFPQEFKIDYLRVFQAPDTAERFESTFVDDQEGWRLVYLPFEGFDRADSQPDGAPNNGLTLNQINGFSINVGEDASNSGAAFATFNATSVQLDRVQLFEAAPDVTPGPGDGIDDGDDDGNVGGDGDDSGDVGAGGQNDGSLPQTGAEVWLLGLASLILALAGVVMVRVRRS